VQDINHIVIEETPDLIVGKTYIVNMFFGNWLKYKNVKGHAPTPDEIAEIERIRRLNAEEYFKKNPLKPSEAYYAACERWPIIKKNT
jgi:hypothetical protein